MEINVSAKVNLSLYITQRLNNGYHCLDMITVPAKVADTVFIYPRNDDKIIVAFEEKDSHKLDEKNNTAYLAAKLIQDEFATNGFDIRVVKNIPIAGGLGGSSADAAGVIIGASKLYGISLLDDRIKAVALQCGADVPCLIEGGYLRIKGIGEQIEKIQTDIDIPMLIAMGYTGVSSKESYKMFDRLDLPFSTNTKANDMLKNALKNSTKMNKNLADALKKYCKNDLQKASIALNPDIQSTLELLNSTNPITAFMTGSGAACVAIYNTKKEQSNAYKKLKKEIIRVW